MDVLQPESEPGQEKVSRTLRRRVVQTADSLQKLTFFDPDDSLDPVTIAQENGRLKGTPPNPSESGDIRDLKNRKKKKTEAVDVTSPSRIQPAVLPPFRAPVFNEAIENSMEAAAAEAGAPAEVRATTASRRLQHSALRAVQSELLE